MRGSFFMQCIQYDMVVSTSMSLVVTSTNVITFTGAKPGKIVSIMAGVHGNEVCGLKAFEKLLPGFSADAGTVHFIYGNLQAISLNKRFIDMNLNRAFRPETSLSEKEKSSYERKRALEIMPLLAETDALLDIHSSATPGSPPFIICEPHSSSVATRLPFQIQSHGWDVLEPGGTDYFVNQHGGMGICIECGYHDDASSVDRAIESIQIFLKLTGIKDDQDDRTISTTYVRQQIVQMYHIHHTRKNFTPIRDFSDFEALSPGQIIGIDGDEKIFAPNTEGNLIVFCRKRVGAGEEAFLIGKVK